MEFLRFGSSIPGAYWGCCAVCIIQDFKQDPDDKASIELVDGDGGSPMVKNGKSQFLGKTWREIFESRLRIGTFNSSDMPNHVFLAVLTAEQIYPSYDGVGYKWLKILKENGFEFIRTTDNSVYSGSNVISSPGGQTKSPHPNYIFGLFRNIGKGAVADPYTPPKAWTDLPGVGVAETYQRAMDVDWKQDALQNQEAHLKLWNASSPAKLYTEEELEKDGVPIWLAGRRSKQPQQLKSRRTTAFTTTPVSTSSPFAKPVASVVVDEEFEATYDIDDECDYYEEE